MLLAFGIWAEIWESSPSLVHYVRDTNALLVGVSFLLRGRAIRTCPVGSAYPISVASFPVAKGPPKREPGHVRLPHCFDIHPPNCHA
jgi:hypothetical protein